MIRPTMWLLLFLFSLLEGWWLVTVVTVTWFAYWYPAWWLFVVAVLLDGYYGTFATVPTLSLVVGGFVLFVEALKIQLRGTHHG